jgi:hypothetical protein
LLKVSFAKWFFAFPACRSPKGNRKTPDPGKGALRSLGAKFSWYDRPPSQTRSRVVVEV